MLSREVVDAEEERIRERIRALPDEERRRVYDEARRALRDPDTYAVLNWFFLFGIHHLYLRRWGRAAANLALFLAGIAALAVGEVLPGVALLLAVTAWELWELFRSQVIVQDWNNRLFREVLARRGHGRE
jgi:hypothetical protein